MGAEPSRERRESLCLDLHVNRKEASGNEQALPVHCITLRPVPLPPPPPAAACYEYLPNT